MYKVWDFEEKKTFFTSDLHFNHDREFVWGPRGFKSCKEMNETQIANWNAVVGKNDRVFVLGDFFLGKDKDFVWDTLDKLNGEIIVVLGNHDTPAKIAIYETHPKIIAIVDAIRGFYKNRKYLGCHYITYTAGLEQDPRHAVFDLFGHTHSKEKFLEDRPTNYNVATDAHNNTPVSIDDIDNDITEKIKECIAFLQ